MKKIFILPEYISFLINQCDKIRDFVIRLSDINNFLLSQKKQWDVKVILDFTRVEEFQELELYDIRMFASLILDSNSFFQKPVSSPEYEKYMFYVVPPIGLFEWVETTELIHFELGMAASTESRVINEKLSDHTLLRIHRFDPGFQPFLVSHKHLELNSLEIDLFFENYISEIVTSKEDFYIFRSSYIGFFRSFDWKNWIPSVNPAPAHEIISFLKKYFKRSNDDYEHLNWGYIMAFLNGGVYNRKLTLINSKKKVVNDVFQVGINKGNSTIFYSIDTENGNLEIYDYRGLHINKVYGLVSGLQNQKRDYSILVPEDTWF